MPQEASPARAFDHSPVPLVVVDRGYRVRGMNGAAERLYGESETAWLGRSATELFTVTYLDGAVGADIVRATIEEGMWRGRVLHTLNDGRTLDVDLTLVSARDENGDHELAFGFMHTAEVSTAEERTGGGGSADARFRSLFERLPLALLIQELDGRILDVNAAAAALYGYERWDLIGRNALETTDGIDPAPVAREPEAFENATTYTVTATGRRRDGSTFPQEVTITRGVLGGRPVAYVMVRDLTEQHRLDAELATLADLSRLYASGRSTPEVAAEALRIACRSLGATRGGLAAFDRDGRIEWLAIEGLESFAQALGDLPATRIEWLQRALSSGRPLLVDRRSPTHRPSVLSELGDRFGMTAYAVVPVRSGEELTGALGLVWGDEPDRAARDPETLETIGRLVGMAVGNARLRDTLIHRQRALDASEARYRTLFAQAPQPILIQSLDGRIIDANRAAATLYGRKVDELRGLLVTDVAAIDPRELDRQTQELLRHRTGVFAGTGVRADGTRFPEEVHIAVAQIEGVDRLLVQVRDLSAQERLQSELLQAQKMEALGHLVSGVAHELNNPLGAIIAFSQLLRLDERLPPELQRDAHLLMEEAERTRRIVQNLLDFARQRPPERRPTSIGSLIERTLELHSYDLGPGRIRVEIDIPSDLPEVDVDRAQIQQVLLNLVQNAIQAIKEVRERGLLRIKARAVDVAGGDGRSAVQVTFEDDGPGVPLAARPHLFEPFFTTKPTGKGTGLGLSVSYGIAAAHAGRLWYEPAEHGGSCFILELPAAASVVQPAPPPEPAPAPTERGRRGAVILAVDDEPSIRDVLKRSLARAGHEVTTAADASDALGVLDRMTFDLLLVDHRMPGMDGCDLYQEVLERRPELRGRALLMSGDVLNERLRGFADEHGLRVLAKPFDVSAIVQLVDELLDEANAEPAGDA